jgi:hypothetical protein
MHGAVRKIAPLAMDDALVFPKRRRVFTQYFTDALGATQLHLYFGDSQISFDEPDLFGFGESLAIQSTFAAGSATTWGEGYAWVRVRPLLAQLLEEGVLNRATPHHYDAATGQRQDGARPSLLPSAPSAVARSWFECESITKELTGRALEIGYLELVVPVFRVAHMAMDAEGRQVGEANVFPKALRVDVPTNWRTCIYAGSRFLADVPMNVSALKSMRADWAQMMAVLLHIREAYLQRFPQARAGWTVGHLERLSTVVLALPTYLLMRTRHRVENGQLHPALSCLFRVTDGLRLTMHQMLFVPIGEPTRAPDAPMSSAEVFAYAERNYSFHSEHGVCAGPKVMVEEFLSVIIDGLAPRSPFVGAFDSAIQAALDDLEPAFDYAMYGLQAHAAIFSMWPIMTRAYEALFGILDAWAAKGSPKVIAYRDQLAVQIQYIRTKTHHAKEEWRTRRELAYADMFAQCEFGLIAGGQHISLSKESVAQRIVPLHLQEDDAIRHQLVEAIGRAFECKSHADGFEINQMAECLQNYFLATQAILRVGCDVQQQLNTLLGRSAPTRSFTAADIDIHNLLQQFEERNLPYLLDEMQALLGLEVSIDKDAIDITNRIRGELTGEPSTTSTVSSSVLLAE